MRRRRGIEEEERSIWQHLFKIARPFEVSTYQRLSIPLHTMPNLLTYILVCYWSFTSGSYAHYCDFHVLDHVRVSFFRHLLAHPFTPFRGFD